MREPLERLTRQFTEAFNRNDLDAVMAFFTADAVYDQLDGVAAHGRDAIRAAFAPQFRGDFGTIRFDEQDVVVDAAGGKTLVRWTCVLTKDGRRRAWRGLDVLEFDGDRIRHKSTYGKAPRPQLE